MVGQEEQNQEPSSFVLADVKAVGIQRWLKADPEPGVRSRLATETLCVAPDRAELIGTDPVVQRKSRPQQLKKSLSLIKSCVIGLMVATVHCG